jgi:hypothetical protein
MNNRDRSIDDKMAALIKGMLLRGDDQSDIAACFLINGGRVSEINTGNSSTGRKFAHIAAAPLGQLPPPGPYPSPYELMTAGNSVWAARVALEHTKEKIEIALKALADAEIKP